MTAAQYEVLTRQVVPPKAVCTSDDIYTYALPMIAKLEREIPGMKLRLMGLRCTNLVSTKKRGIDFFGTGELSKAKSRTDPFSANNKTRLEQEEGGGDDNGEWEVWPEGEFEEAARHEREADMNDIEQLSQELQDQDLESSNSPSIRSKHKALDDINDSQRSSRQQQQLQQHPPWSCPICNRSQPGNDKTFNAHIDYCLSRQTIKEAAARETSPPATATSSSGPAGGVPQTPLPPLSLRSEPKTKDSGSGRGRGRGRPKKKRKFGEEESEGKKQKQQILFGR